MKLFLDFIENWQTLIAGFLALGAGIYGARVLNKQITLSEKQEAARTKAREDAARVVLPLTLSTIIEYAQKSSHFLYRYYKAIEDNVVPESVRNVTPPSVPEMAISSLQTVVETTTNPEISRVVSKLVGRVQIQSARIRDTIHSPEMARDDGLWIVTAENVASYVVDTAIIYAFASSLFDYARFKSESPKETTWDDVACSLRAMLWFEDHKLVYDKLSDCQSKQKLVE